VRKNSEVFMNRRDFLQASNISHKDNSDLLTEIAPRFDTGSGSDLKDIKKSETQVKTQSKNPQYPGLLANSLEPYSGPWNESTAAHLLRRTSFGPAQADIKYFAGKTLNDSLTELMATQPDPALPVDPTTGTTWIGQTYSGAASDRKYASYLKGWWMGLMTSGKMSIIEKMTLFWHNHFVSGYDTVKDSRYMYNQNTLFRKYALGNIRQLAIEVSKDPAMLRYLNGNTNIAGHANENYGRELMELFTIGKGPEISPGNYTTYTEDDVQAAARVLTGWIDISKTVTSAFVPNRHDTDDKLFSPDFDNFVIKGESGPNSGPDELNQLIICSLPRKLHHYF
jgi:hypothetical protein